MLHPSFSVHCGDCSSTTPGNVGKSDGTSDPASDGACDTDGAVVGDLVTVGCFVVGTLVGDVLGVDVGIAVVGVADGAGVTGVAVVGDVVGVIVSPAVGAVDGTSTTAGASVIATGAPVATGAVVGAPVSGIGASTGASVKNGVDCATIWDNKNDDAIISFMVEIVFRVLLSMVE